MSAAWLQDAVCTGTCNAAGKWFVINSASLWLQGQVLNLTSAWWMQQTRHLAANALLDVPDPNVSIMQRCTVFPVEFVVRGFLTGDTPCSPGLHALSGLT